MKRLRKILGTGMLFVLLAVVLSACSSEKEDAITEGGRESLPSVTATAEKTENKKEEEKPVIRVIEKAEEPEELPEIKTEEISEEEILPEKEPEEIDLSENSEEKEEEAMQL